MSRLMRELTQLAESLINQEALAAAEKLLPLSSRRRENFPTCREDHRTWQRPC